MTVKQTTKTSQDMKATFEEFKTRKEVIAAGFNFAGATTDETMKQEIARDYRGAGYKLAFVREQGRITYWAKRVEVPALQPFNIGPV